MNEPSADTIELAAEMLEEKTWQKVAHRVTALDANWSHALRITQLADKIIITATLTVKGISREGIGITKQSDALQIRNAERQAFYAAAEKFSERNISEKPKNEIPVEKLPTVDQAEVFPPDQAKLVLRWRTEIKEGLESINVKPENALNRYDTKQAGLFKKQYARDETVKFVLAEKRKKVTEGYAHSGWDIDEIERDMKKFGIENGLQTATGQQIEAVFNEMRTSKMF